MKKLSIKGNPGQNNSFTEVTMEVGCYNPNALVVNHYHYSDQTRIDAYFQKLRIEITNNTKCEVLEELKVYNTKLDESMGLLERLTDGGFTQKDIICALRMKEQYTQKAIKYECYPSAQGINLMLFSMIKTKFDRYIFPLIKQRVSIDIVLQHIDLIIVSHIMQLLNENGANDMDLHYTSDHIYGMLYFLTDKSHLSWKDYDNPIP